jgi:ribosomal protein S18 acetylase RimI-like enzyme
MIYAHRITSILCLCTGMLLLQACEKNQSELNTGSIKTMNNTKESKPNAGRFTVQDKTGTPIILEWQKTTLVAPEFATAMKEAWPLAREAYTPVEMQFLHKFPQVVGSEPYFKAFEPLFKNGLKAVDWTKAEETMQTLLKSHFIFDASTWGPEVLAMYAKDVCYVVTARDQQTKTLLGFITFMIRPSYAHGDVKVMSFAVAVHHQNRGLGKLLMSSILKIDANLKRIFLCTRVTNDGALKAYRAWGFVADEHPILDHAFNLEHWIFFKYEFSKSNILLKTAARLKGV